ncbi:hypothetical protein TcWFU_006042 [Taenia crassiceps]|uniref:Uncharacterized protein n=1 Tax=Taenia crassiceps TaxID=6207 RepID=A0ABR4Q808_9CEST
MGKDSQLRVEFYWIFEPAFARANAVCCQISSAFCFILALGLVIGGAVLIDKNSGVLYRWTEICEDVYPISPSSDTSHVWDGICDNFSGEQRNFAIGIAMVFFGCVFMVVASVMMCCACGFLAFSDTSKSVITVTQQPQMVNQMPMGSYSNQPKTPQFVAPSYQPNQPQVPLGYPIQTTPYPTAPAYSMPPTVPPTYDQATETPDALSMPTKNHIN